VTEGGRGKRNKVEIDKTKRRERENRKVEEMEKS
jgi:hypothetical protein